MLQVITYIDYNRKEIIINGEYYINLLDRFNRDLKKRGHHLTKNKVLFYEDNARTHRFVVALVKFSELEYESLPYAPYSSKLFLQRPFSVFKLEEISLWNKM